MTYFRLTIFSILLTIASPLIAYSGGSSYSRYGFGDILRYGDGRLYAMAGTSISLIDDGFINSLNPAGMARISFTRFSGGFEYNSFSSKDESNSSTYSSAGFQGILVAFPISRENGIVMSLESTPFSSVKYALEYSRMDNNIGSVLNQKFYGSGGLSNLGIGLSGSILNNLHIGGRFCYVYGRTRMYQTSTYDNSDYIGATLDESIYYSGFTFTFGSIYEGISNLLNSPALENLTVGLTLKASSNLDAEKQTLYSSIDSTFTQKGKAEIPLSLGIGLSYLFKDSYRVLGDLYFENWGNVKIFSPETGTIRNSLRTSVGFETIPAKKADTFLKRVAYRLGLAYNSTYYTVHGIGINELLMSGGVGLPLGPESQLNVGLQVGLRGSTDNKLQKDTIFRLSASISASEIWFLKFEEE